MEMFTGIFYILAAVWFIWLAYMMTTKNLRSFIMVKFIPFALGLVSAFLAFHHYGFIIQLG